MLGTESNITESNIEDHSFKLRHVWSIAGTAAVLMGLLFFQHPLAFTDIKTSLSLRPNLDLAAWFSAGPVAPEHGAVLGAETYNSAILANFSNIKFKIIDNNSPAEIQLYAQELQNVYQADQVANLDSDHILKFLTDIQQLAVPTGMANYHRLLLGYLEIQNGQILNTAQNPDLGEQTTQALEVERNNIQATYTLSNMP